LPRFARNDNKESYSILSTYPFEPFNKID